MGSQLAPGFFVNFFLKVLFKPARLLIDTGSIKYGNNNKSINENTEKNEKVYKKKKRNSKMEEIKNTKIIISFLFFFVIVVVFFKRFCFPPRQIWWAQIRHTPDSTHLWSRRSASELLILRIVFPLSLGRFWARGAHLLAPIVRQRKFVWFRFSKSHPDGLSLDLKRPKLELIGRLTLNLKAYYLWLVWTFKKFNLDLI